MQPLTIIQVIIAVALIAAILLQNRSAGAGGLFGGGTGGSTGGDFSAKRGLEKLLFRATIALALAFLVVALLNLAQ